MDYMILIISSLVTGFIFQSVVEIPSYFATTDKSRIVIARKPGKDASYVERTSEGFSWQSPKVEIASSLAIISLVTGFIF